MSDLRDRLAGLTPAQREQLARRLAARDRAPAVPAPTPAVEPIAIVSAACRLPGGVRSPEDLWALLCEGRDGVGPVPPERWDGAALSAPAESGDRIAAPTGGFLDAVDAFDAAFFGISPREAELMDPQQRLLLELGWEAFERAGLPVERLAGQAVGVFIGAHSLSVDYHLLQLAQPGALASHASTGSAHAILANRLSYVFDLRGPSMTIDTACSSSLVAVHQACQSLRTGESDLALAGGVNLMLLPTASLLFTQLEILSPQGRCRTFDAAADGIARGEGCGLVVLKRLRDAQRDGDPVLAVILGSAVNQDGASNGLTAPNGPAQVAVVRRALAMAGVDPARLGLVETHGTGTALGDPVEVEALAEVIGPRRDADHTCYLGALKTQLGHLEAAAGIAGLIKAMLCVQHGRIPANLHFTQVNPHIRLEGTPLALPLETRDWPAIAGPRVAGTSSFGFGGTNAHVVLCAPDTPPGVATPAAAPVRPRVLVLGARSPAARQAWMQAHRDALVKLAAQSPSSSQSSLDDYLHTANARRSHGPWRVAVTGSTADELAAALAARGDDLPPPVEQPAAPVFVYTGQGSQWATMGRELLDTEPVFREAVQAVAQAFDALAGGALIELLRDPDAADRLQDTDAAQAALFAMQVGLTALWQSWGIVPAAVVGHSVGEVAAAHAAGMLTLADAVRVVHQRGRLMQAGAARGRMVQVDRAADTLQAVLLPWAGQVSVAGLNGPSTTVLSGSAEAIEAVSEALRREGADLRELPVAFAFHSALMQPVCEPLAQALAGIVVQPAARPVVSTVHGGWSRDGDFAAAYWARNVREPVRFAPAIDELLAAGFSTFVEVGPHPSLSAAVLDGAARRGREAVVVASLRKGRPARAALLEGLARLAEAGAPVDWAALSAPGAQVVPVPAYPWQHQHLWLPRPDPAALVFHAFGHSARDAGRADPDLARDSLGLAVHWQRTPGADLAHPMPAVDLPALAAQAATAAQALPGAAELAGESDLMARVERRAAEHALAAVLALAGPLVPDRHVSADPQAHGVAARHARLWERVLDILGDEGVLQRDGNGLRVMPAAALPRPAVPFSPAEAGRIELALLERCGAALADVLRGRVEPLSLLFPDDDTVSASTLYRDAGASRVYNPLLARTVALAVQQRGGAPVRVLEIGAGTGATTACLLDVLPPGTPYCFTDLSAGFLDAARQRFAHWGDAFETRTLDIEQPVATQGLAPGSFDVVVASNVIHATGDLRESLAQARSLLAPGGLLVLLETLTPRRWTSLTFGLTAGWWRFRDPGLRQRDPTLPLDAWLPLLRDSGFDEVVAVGAELSARALHPQALLVARAAAAPTTTATTLSPGGGWWLVGPAHGARQALADTLAAAGQTARLLAPEAVLAMPQVLLDEQLAGLHGVVVWDTPVVPDAGQSPEAALAAALAPAVRLGQALASPRSSQSGGARLWIVTEGAQVVEPGEADVALAQSPLWGWGRSMALEHPAAWGGLVDLDPALAPTEAAAAVRHELQRKDADDQVAWRRSGRHVPRLQPTARPGAAAPTLSAEGAYLVTGGYGSLGPRIARWLAGLGARHIVLMGRQGPQAADATRLAGLQARLHAQGVTLHTERGDVARRADVAAVFERARAAGHPIRGVVHAAAGFEPCALAGQDLPALLAAMRAKTDGTWWLHEQLAGPQCDLFVLFSSITTVLGAKGLAAYAAANQFLQAMAGWRAARGLPAVCVDWGTWHDERAQGMARRGNTEALGLRELPDEQAFGWLSDLVGAGVRQQVVARVDWPIALEAYQVHGPRPMLAELARLFTAPPAAAPATASQTATAAPSSAAPDASAWRAQLQGASAAHRADRVTALVRQELGRVLGLPPDSIGERTGFFDLGLDSLMAVQLRRRLSAALGESLPATLTFNFPSIEALAAHLLERLGGTASPAAAAPAPAAMPAAPAAAAPASEVAALSDEQVRAELLAEFGDLLDDHPPEPSRR